MSLKSLSILALSVAAFGCADRSIETARGSDGGDLPNVLATVGSEQITLADIRARIGGQLDQIDAQYSESQYRRSRSKAVDAALDDLVRERLIDAEARRLGKSAEDLMAAEAGAGGLIPGDSDIRAWYNENRALLEGRTLQQLHAQIADFLQQQRREEVMTRLEQRLRTENLVKVNFQPYRVTLNNDGAPSTGPRNALVTVVEFSDFECPFCGQFYPAIKQLEQEFGSDLRVVYRQFPLTGIHPNAWKAAEASLCAHEQGRFWEMHDLLFQEQARLRVGDLKEKAGRLGLNGPEFSSCLDSGRQRDRVQIDVDEGLRAGVAGTPALFVNGALVEGGAVPYAILAEAVRKELARVKSR